MPDNDTDSGQRKEHRNRNAAIALLEAVQEGFEILSASKASVYSVSLDQILSTSGRSSASTFAKFYN